MVAFSPGERGWVIEGDELPGELLSFVEAEDAEHFRGVKVRLLEGLCLLVGWNCASAALAGRLRWYGVLGQACLE